MLVAMKIGEDDDGCVSSKLDCVSRPVDMLFKKLSWLKNRHLRIFVYPEPEAVAMAILLWHFAYASYNFRHDFLTNSSKVDK